MFVMDTKFPYFLAFIEVYTKCTSLRCDLIDLVHWNFMPKDGMTFPIVWKTIWLIGIANLVVVLVADRDYKLAIVRKEVIFFCSKAHKILYTLDR